MKASELVQLIQELIKEHGDCYVASTGYYGDEEVTDIEVGFFDRVIPGITEKRMSSGEFEPAREYDAAVCVKEKVFIFLPGSCA